jgi:hypothetical protein
MPERVAAILAETGPALSSWIVKRLIKTGVSRVTARKQVSRAHGAVQRLKGMRLPNREQFLFLRDQFGSEDFRLNLEQAFIDTHSTYGRTLVAIRARGGTIPESHFAVVAGLPVEKAKGQLLANLVMARLEQVKLITRASSPEGDIIGTWDSGPMTNRRRAVLIVEDAILNALKTWLAKINWTSPQAAKTRARGLTPQFGQFRFDLVGPSYLNSIVHFKSERKINGFIVGDILLDRDISVGDLDPFFSKWAC